MPFKGKKRIIEKNQSMASKIIKICVVNIKSGTAWLFDANWKYILMWAGVTIQILLKSKFIFIVVVGIFSILAKK